MSRAASSAPRLVRLSARDNVAVAIVAVVSGEVLAGNGYSITATQDIPAGHKIALTAIAAGQKIIKYGHPIGSAICNVGPGEHVHGHNLKSDYI
jgi:altronate hydrolase